MMAETIETSKHSASEIEGALVRQIRSGEIAQDNPLPTERELCERFGASRPTVREALIALQVRGFVSSETGKRPRASKPSLTDILKGTGEHLRDILGDTETGAYLEQMRQFIETGAAREAATHANGVQVAKIKAALDNNFDAIGTHDFPDTDIAFHRALVSVLGNPVILTLHDMFVSEVLRLRPSAADREASDRKTYEEHLEVYQAILDGDAALATDLLDRHLARSYRKRLGMPKGY